ncbi:hypothetical protein ACO2KH_01900 [Leptospira terpstrae]|uniref:hypothetical protein n=1 Tax=Leptospira terpstrae TaxID=293075 RepID=UPI003D02F9A8
MEINYKFRILYIYSLILLITSPLISQPEKENIVILVDENKAIYGEYIDTGNNWFIRNEQKGLSVDKNRVKSIVTKDYFESIRRKTPWNSTVESLIFFDSSANYQWFEDKDRVFNETLFFRITKLTLLFATAYFYNESVKANEALKKSVYGLSTNAERKFNEQYRNYQITATLALLTFTYTSVIAYIRFGRDSKFNNLEIQNRQTYEIEEFLRAESEKKTSLNSQQNYLEFAMSKKF